MSVSDAPAPSRPPRRGRTSATLALACLAASLLVVNAAFLLWPNLDLAPGGMPTEAPAAEAVVLEFVEPTTQPPPPANLPPPPPPPVDSELPPVEVPDEEIIEEIVQDLPIPTLPARPSPAPSAPSVPGPTALPAAPGPPGPGPAANRIVERPERSPRLVRASLPVYPPQAQREGIRARATVRVLISEGGQVVDATITERVLIGRSDEETVVPSLPYGLEDAALDAARRHLFRPARDDGERVRAYAVISLSFDPPR